MLVGIDRAQRASSSWATAYTAWSVPPWWRRSPTKSPVTPLPRPVRLSPGSRTCTGPEAGALLLGLMRPTVDSRRQLRDLTGVPLLGMVTMIETEQRRRQARRGNLMFIAGGVALGLALVAQLIYYLALSPAA